MKNNNSIIITIAMVVMVIIALALLTKLDSKNIKAKPVEARLGKYDMLAKCLSEKGVKLYGAYWNGHFQDQKKLFGPSFEFVDYNECAIPNRIMQTTEVCQKAKIEQYPTWDFPGGVRKTGELSMEELSNISGCQLPTLTAALNTR